LETSASFQQYKNVIKFNSTNYKRVTERFTYLDDEEYRLAKGKEISLGFDLGKQVLMGALVSG